MCHRGGVATARKDQQPKHSQKRARQGQGISMDALVRAGTCAYVSLKSVSQPSSIISSGPRFNTGSSSNLPRPRTRCSYLCVRVCMGACIHSNNVANLLPAFHGPSKLLASIPPILHSIGQYITQPCIPDYRPTFVTALSSAMRLMQDSQSIQPRVIL